MLNRGYVYFCSRDVDNHIGGIPIDVSIPSHGVDEGIANVVGPRLGDLVARYPDDEFMRRVAGTARITTYPVVSDGRAVGMLPLSLVLATPWQEWNRRRA